MKNVKGFVIMSKAWYGKSILNDVAYEDEILFRLYNENDVSEASIKWYYLNGILSTKVEVFSDAWCLFDECSDFFNMIGTLNRDLSVDEIVHCLEECGFIDETPYQQD